MKYAQRRDANFNREQERWESMDAKRTLEDQRAVGAFAFVLTNLPRLALRASAAVLSQRRRPPSMCLCLSLRPQRA